MAEVPTALPPRAGGPSGVGVSGFRQHLTAHPAFSFLCRCWRVWEEHHCQTDEVSDPCTTGSETSGGWGKLPIGVATERGWGNAPWDAQQRADLARVSPMSPGSSMRMATRRRSAGSTKPWSTVTPSSPSWPLSRQWGTCRLTLETPPERWVPTVLCLAGVGCPGEQKQMCPKLGQD